MLELAASSQQWELGHLALGKPGAKSEKREKFFNALQLTREQNNRFYLKLPVCLFKNRKCAGCSSNDESHIYMKWLIVVLFVVHRHRVLLYSCLAKASALRQLECELFVCVCVRPASYSLSCQAQVNRNPGACLWSEVETRPL